MRRFLVGRVMIVVSALVLAAMVLVGSDNAVGQDKKKISFRTKPENTKVTFLHRLEIPDTAGHRISMGEIRRTWPDGGGPVIEGRKAIEGTSWETSDTVAFNGHTHGYNVTRFDNGDQTFSEYHNTIQSVVNPDRTRKLTVLGTSVVTGVLEPSRASRVSGRARRLRTTASTTSQCESTPRTSLNTGSRSSTRVNDITARNGRRCFRPFVFSVVTPRHLARLVSRR